MFLISHFEALALPSVGCHGLWENGLGGHVRRNQPPPPVEERTDAPQLGCT